MKERIIGLYTPAHIVIVVFLIIAVVSGLIVIKKKVRTERSLRILLSVLSSAMLALLIATRISHVYHSITEEVKIDCFGTQRSYSWVMLFPDSYCSLIALFLPFAVFAGKYKNNRFIEAVFSLAILGMLSNIFYPEYVGRIPFLEFRAFGALLYHVLCGFIFSVLLLTGNIVPKLKNWYYAPVAISLIMTLGLFELTCLGYAEAFNITHPLIPGLYVSSWWFLCLGYVLFDVVSRVICRLASERTKK